MKTSDNIIKCLSCGWTGEETEIISVAHPLIKEFTIYCCPKCKEIERFGSVVIELDEFDYHELIDRIFVLQNSFNDSIINHQTCTLNIDLKNDAEKISDLLGAFLQKVGKISHEHDKEFNI